MLKRLAAISTLLLAGCAYDPAEQLAGTWEGREADGSPLVMTFEKGGALSVSVGGQSGAGKFVVNANTAPVHLDLDFQLHGDPIRSKTIFVFLSRDQLKFAQPRAERPADFDGKSLVLSRRK